MTDETNAGDLSLWLSSYGALTANQILERFHLRLGADELMPAIKNPLSIYHQLLTVPLQNVFNGIILQQARAYQLYAQKLFIDYLLSGESGKSEELPGANTREELDLQRIKLVEVDEAFGQQEFAHHELISESQALLIQLSKKLIDLLSETTEKVNQLLRAQHIVKEESLIQRAIRTSMIHHATINKEGFAPQSSGWADVEKVLAVTLTEQLKHNLADVLISLTDLRQDIEQTISPYKERTADMRIGLRSYRQQFYDIILRSTELISLLPEYKIDTSQIKINRASLHFDPSIGDL